MSERVDTTRTIAAVEAEIAATTELRNQSVGSKKGMLTRKLKKLAQEHIELDPVLGRTPMDGPESSDINMGAANGNPLCQDDMPGFSDDAADGQPYDVVDAKNARDAGRPLADKPHIVDSDTINGVRYSIDSEGGVWAPEGAARCGHRIGFVSRDDKKMWRGSYGDGSLPGVKPNRSRRAVLVALVAAT